MTQPNMVASRTIGTLVYRIDAANRLTWVNEAWIEFAQANHGESLMPGSVLGRDLLAALADPTVRQLYATMIRRVRTGATVRFDYRCDAPEARRTFTMEIRRRADGEVEFTSTLRREEPRAAVALLQVGVPRDRERFIRMCSWCQNVALPSGDWVAVEEAVARLGLLEVERMPGITHGLCESCLQRATTELGLG